MLTFKNIYGLLLNDGDRRPSEQNIGREKIWVIESQSNGCSRPPGDLMTHIFLLYWSVCIQSPHRREQNHPTVKLAVKRPGRGNWTQPPVKDKRGLTAIMLEAGHSKPMAWRGTTKKSLPRNMSGTTYGLRLSVMSQATFSNKAGGWLKHG